MKLNAHIAAEAAGHLKRTETAVEQDPDGMPAALARQRFGGYILALADMTNSTRAELMRWIETGDPELAPSLWSPQPEDPVVVVTRLEFNVVGANSDALAKAATARLREFAGEDLEGWSIDLRAVHNGREWGAAAVATLGR